MNIQINYTLQEATELLQDHIKDYLLLAGSSNPVNMNSLDTITVLIKNPAETGGSYTVGQMQSLIKTALSENRDHGKVSAIKVVRNQSETYGPVMGLFDAKNLVETILQQN